MNFPRFPDRRSAGRDLAKHLSKFTGDSDIVVLALPRGGVPVAYEVAQALRAPLDVIVVRKLGFPGREELAIGAIASGGTLVIDPDLVAGVSQAELDAVATREVAELTRRERTYRDGRPPIEVNGKLAIVVDDGLATGASMRAAISALRERGVRRIVVAVPLASRQAVASLEREADSVVAVFVPEVLYAVGVHYKDFSQTTDKEVRDLLAQSVGRRERSWPNERRIERERLGNRRAAT
ncbi:MAG TPA: phosphoribosyltransferase [Candidatus Eremiobacteraceae bacterium]|nr:phosphoribosyltransferase [Candidatus Eremiobacteraceae bacterium]